jgi:hypothetical protein
LGYTDQSVLHVTVGREYFVFAISMWRGILQVLLSDDNGLPNWYPMECFSVTDEHLPDDWLFAFYGRDESADLQALWGYADLIHDDEHYDLLLERDESAMNIFVRESASRLKRNQDK